MKPVTESSRRNLPLLLDWLHNGPPATEAELAEYAHRLASYASTGPQAGLPFDTSKDANDGR